MSARPGSGEVTVVVVASGLVKTNVWTGRFLGLSSETNAVTNRAPTGRLKTLNWLVSFSIGPEWQCAQTPLGTLLSNHVAPRFSASVVPAGSAGGAPPLE